MALASGRDCLWIAFLAAAYALRAVPRFARLRCLRRIAAVLGTLWHAADRSRAARVRSNLRVALGSRCSHAEVERSVKDFFINLARALLVNDMLPTLTSAELREVLSIEGVDHLDAALSRQRGVVLLGAHFGLHAYAALALLQGLGYPAAILTAEGIAHDEASWFYRRIVLPIRYRCHAHINVITRTGLPLRGVVASLRQNQILMMMGDVLDNRVVTLPAPNVLSAPLLGGSVPLNTGPFRLARWVGAPVLPFFVVPRASRFALVIEPPLILSQQPWAAGLADDLAAFTARLEPYLLRYPGLWFGARNHDLSGLMVRTEPPENSSLTPDLMPHASNRH